MRAQTAIIAVTIGALAAAGAFGTGDSEAEEQTTTVTMWDYQNVEAWTNAYNEIVAKYQETHPNVQVAPPVGLAGTGPRAPGTQP